MLLNFAGNRVRLATHANFKDFVLTAGLEFFPLGGDPKVLAECSYFLFNEGQGIYQLSRLIYQTYS
ncbi:putative sterol 3-beta-glucosyltransferase [Rosa chinensis]|uniref:Putative sterol 3-beta-glucosyltransferase n=1 Tax=Rosa chinensis TaxID=74649 RepID=A0A2P6S891_ROSCH|nr:putative sterol 3-beta-glucosyltransferase [Rosa chinensis]